MESRDFKLVFDRLPEAIVIVEADGVGSYVNPAAARVLSHLRRFDPSHPVRDAEWGIVDSSGRPLSGDALPSEVTRLTGRELHDVEIGAPTRDGELRWLRVSTRRLDAGPLPCAVVSTYVDVSSRHRLAAELADARLAHETMVESLTQGVVLHDASGGVLESNSSAARVTGLTRDQLHRRAPMPDGWIVVDETGRVLATHELPLSLVLEEGAAQLGRIIGVSAAGREQRWLRVNVSPLREANGTLIGAVTSFADITAQRQAEVARMEATERFETSFAHAPSGIALLGFDGRLTRANAALCRILGRGEQELIDTAGASYTHPDDLEATEGVLERLGSGTTAVPLEKRYVRPDGQIVWASIQTATVRDANGRPSHVVAHVQDITALKVAERERAEAMKLFETVFASAPTAVALFDLDMRLRRGNARLFEMLGRDPAELLGETLHTITHPDDVGLTSGAWNALRDGSKTTAVQKRYLRPDGGVVWAQTHGTTICDAQGNPSFVVSHLHDITAQKAAELKQAEVTAEFEAAFSDGPIGMAVVSLGGHWLRVNRQLCQLLGYREDELLALTFQEITHPDDLDADLELVGQLLSGEIARYSMEKRYRTAQGNLLWATLAVSLVRDPEGAPLHFISQIEDITERKRLERELQHMADHDSLTELINRRRFDEALSLQVKRSRRYRERAALLAIDLNEFKAINDRYGHQAGDAVLVAVARGLQRRLRTTDIVARLGGDEFAAILVNVTPREAEELAAILRETIRALRIPAAGAELRISASIGVAVIDAATLDPAAPLIAADTAMYNDKVAGRPATVTRLPVRPEPTASIIA